MSEIVDLSDKTVLITGAGFDIGKALSVAFAKLGATLLLLDSNAKALDAVYDEIIAQGSPEPLIIELDLAKLDKANASLINENIFSEFGRLDSLIHTANWTFPLSPLAVYEESFWNKAMHHLHFAPFLLSQQLLPALAAAQKARVVFSLYGCGTTPKAFWGPYGAAYAALQNTCDVWNTELQAQDTRFSALDPGSVLTQIRVKHYPAEDQNRLIPSDDPSLIQRYLSSISS